jgi:predicted SnoaL-like aldol condensation-catalyzing enzyme
MKQFILMLCVAMVVAPTVHGAPVFPESLLTTVQTKAMPPNHQQQLNTQNVLEFYEKGLNLKDADAAIKYLGTAYTQHNPMAADGPEGFRKFIAFLKEKYPQSHSEIKQVFADGDYVILHVHTVREPGSRGSAIIDIFRLEQGKIIEHWDVTQSIPEQTVSGNAMF